MVGEDKKDMDFFSYIKNNKALIPVFFSGILTYEVFDHFFSEGMRPGAGAEGDITGFIALPSRHHRYFWPRDFMPLLTLCFAYFLPDLLSAFLWIGENQLDQGENYS